MNTEMKDDIEELLEEAWNEATIDAMEYACNCGTPEVPCDHCSISMSARRKFDKAIALLRQYQKLREAVCVLEDGGKAEVGDIILWAKDTQPQCIKVHSIKDGVLYAEVDMEGDIELTSIWWKWDTIIQRGGKPCVYRSELEGI